MDFLSKTKLLSFIFGVFASFIATLLYEYLWLPFGFFYKPTRIELIDSLGNKVNDDIRIYVITSPTLVNKDGLIELDFSGFPYKRDSWLYVENGQGETSLIEKPVALHLQDRDKTVPIVLEKKRKVLASITTLNKEVSCKIYAITEDNQYDPIYPARKDGKWFVFYLPRIKQFSFKYNCTNGETLTCDGTKGIFQKLTSTSKNCV